MKYAYHMPHSYIAYIDESGDDGLSKFRAPGNQGGSSKWLIISACIMRLHYSQEAVAWRDEIKQIVPNKKGRSIHFKNFNHQQKVAATQILSSKPLRIFGILSDKRTIPAGTYEKKNKLYWYLTRYLIERVSWFCRDQRRIVRSGNGTVKIVFSRRGGMSYQDFRNYLGRLKNSNDDSIRIHWPVIDIDAITAQDHSRSAGLQLADCSASALAAAFEPDIYGNCEKRYLENLRRAVYHRNGNYLSYGLKIVPRPEEITLTQDQTLAINIFR